MAASCRTFLTSAKYVRRVYGLQQCYVYSESLLFPWLCTRHVSYCQNNSCLVPPGKLASIDGLNCKVHRWTVPEHNLTFLHFYSSSSPTTTSKWAIVRLVQKSSELTEKILYKISPKLHGMYRQFIDGGKAFIGDVRFVYNLRGRMKTEGLQLQDLPWKDIYVKDKVTRDMGKVIPTMVVTWLPFAFYVMLPLIFTFPRQFLSDHFLNKGQLAEFRKKSLRRRFLEGDKLWELIDERKPRSDSIEGGDPGRVIGQRAGLNDVQDLARLRPRFDDQLSLEKLPRNHLVSLCKLHSLLTLMLPSFILRQRLEGKCAVLQAIDFALTRDGLDTIEEQDMKKLCYQRAFETYGASPSAMQACLNSWLQTAAVLKASEKSIYLHLPLFKKKP